jgi:DNA-binding HxlR family transcriptional regulator
MKARQGMLLVTTCVVRTFWFLSTGFTDMGAHKANLYSGLCPSRNLLSLVGTKWAMLIIVVLREGAVRTGALRRMVGGISQKMLTQTLRELERNGLVERIAYEEVPPRVEYRLTALGRSLSELVMQIEAWVTKHYGRIVTLQDEFDSQATSA